LGRCVACNCNGHSSFCDPDTGVCLNCMHNTVGDYCQQCAPGFTGNALIGSQDDCKPIKDECNCDRRGSVSDTCPGGQCICKVFSQF
jgi:hypothetical protein